MSDVETIKDRLDIVDVVGSYLKLNKAGKNFRARCPFHNERTPSFHVSPERQSYHCFGCGASGDIFSFVEQFEGVDFRGALTILADRAGVTLQKVNLKAKDERERLYQIMETATVFFQRNFLQSEAAKDYIKKRGLVEPTVRRWRLGYALADWRTLFEYLLKHGFSEKEMLTAGLVKRSSDGGSSRLYDTFRDRIIFPIADASGRIVAFSGRILTATDDAPKYLNSPDTPLFNKSQTLFGLHFAKQAIREQGYAIIVEGQMDLIMSHQAGVVNAVATSGTALTGAHLARLKKIAPRVVFAFDADSAGEKAVERGVSMGGVFLDSVMAYRQGMSPKVVSLPEGKDPADLAIGDGKPWKDALKATTYAIDFFVDRACLKSEAQERNKYIRTVILPLIKAVESSIDRADIVNKTANKLKIPEKAIWEDLERVSVSETVDVKKTDEERVVSEQLPRLLMRGEPARELFAILLSPQKSETVEKRLHKLLEKDFDTLLKEATLIKDELLFEIERYEEKISDKQLEELFLRLEESILQVELMRLERELSLAEAAGDGALAEKLLLLCRDAAAQREKVVKARQSLSS